MEKQTIGHFERINKDSKAEVRNRENEFEETQRLSSSSPFFGTVVSSQPIHCTSPSSQTPCLPSTS
jgi:hypothetical protein